ncbi:MAG: hypothetical protein IKP10_01395 [Clostridia bacterium]|nr:hypothetical protein [Clostridia bacterium]
MKRITALLMGLMMALSLTAAWGEAPAYDAQALITEAAAGMDDNVYTVIGLLSTDPWSEEIMIDTYLCRILFPDTSASLGAAVIARHGDQAQVMGAMYLPYTDDDGSPEIPAAETLAMLFSDLAALPEGSAGASLHRARAVMETLVNAAVYSYDRIDSEKITAVLEEAAAALTEEQRAALAVSGQAVYEEVLRLCDPAEELGGEYADAGVAEVMEALRGEEAVMASAKTIAEMMVK